jgi:ribosomal subunit interface protein
MNISIQSQSFPLTTALEQRIHRRIASATRRFSRFITTVDVYLEDLNGPKGGEDMSVRILATMQDRQSIVVDATHTDMYKAIDRAGSRARRAIKRSLQKGRRIDRAQLRLLRRSGSFA